MKLTGKILKYLLLISLCILFLGVIFQYKAIARYMNLQKLYVYGLSGGLFLIIYLSLLRRIMKFWEVFSHELTHLLFAVFTLNKIEGFSVSFSGGAVSYRGNTNWLVKLSPYFFPLSSFFVLIVSLFLNDNYQLYINHLLVITYLFYALTAIDSFSLRQPDISSSGYIFSVVFIVIINVFLLLFVIFYLQNNLDNYWQIIQKATDFGRYIYV
jgi:hypothetical protein